MSGTDGAATVAEPVLADFPVRRRGAWLEKFAVGEVFDHHWGRTITDGDNAVFSTVTCNWNPMHLNAEFARAHGHEDVVVNSMLVLCTVIGLSVEDLSESGGPFVAIDDCVFEKPVFPGDTLTVRSTVLDSRESRSRPKAGIVTWRTEAINQNGARVLHYIRKNLIAKDSSR
ncbi:MaoC family dehydratase [Amycolatopsis sp.]|jgi:acyl dehydratase|uniref:MaoC family dehydratase n=1 Tax=Amycolatopsis sp. TaxID=37632 RepID=UPI002DFD8727|nr:MaoC family dehydratase [Amycolatopsis sp.]